MRNLNFSKRVLEIVRSIKRGSFLTYKEVAKLAGNDKAVRVVGNILAKNKDPKIPCHRVIRNDGEVGKYQGSSKNTWKKVALLLKEGAVGVIPTDTIYGILGSALNKKTVKKIYQLKKRNPKKPSIILISSLDDLKIFKIKLKEWQRKILEKITPSKISFILPCFEKKFSYLNGGRNTLAFRVPNSKELTRVLKISGPLIAPSANFEGKEPAKSIHEAKKYFGKEVFYWDKGKRKACPSTLIDLTTKKIKIERKGGDFKKICAFLNKYSLEL